MSQRHTNDTKTARLSLKKETLRALQLRTLSDAELGGVAGGRSGMCAPSCQTRC